MIDSEKSTTFSKNILLYVKTILNDSLINKLHSSITKSTKLLEDNLRTIFLNEI